MRNADHRHENQRTRRDASVVWLDNARIIAIFGVVVLHLSARVMLKHPMGSMFWWVGNIGDSIARWSVPVFVMISGALLLDPTKEEGILVFYKKRAARILLPMAAWTLFYLLWPYLQQRVGWDELSVAALAKKVAFGRPYYHMWFLYMIAGLYLFTPFIRKIVKYSSRKELVFLVWLMFALAVIRDADLSFRPIRYQLFLTMFLPYMPYFMLGYLISTTDLNPSKHILLAAAATLVTLTCLGYFAVKQRFPSSSVSYFYNNLGVTVIPMSMSVILLLKKVDKPIFGNRLTAKVSALTMGVYLVHPAVIEILGRMGLHSTSFHPALAVPVVAIVVVGVSFFLVWMIRKGTFVRRFV